MQLAYEELELLTTDPEDRTLPRVHTTRADDEKDDRQQLARAESHTRTQLELLIKQLQKQREMCVNKDVRNGFTAALAPLEARLKRYLDAEEEERKKREKRKVDLASTYIFVHMRSALRSMHVLSIQECHATYSYGTKSKSA